MSVEKVHIVDIITKSEKKIPPLLLNFQNGTLKNGKDDGSEIFMAENKKVDEKLLVYANANWVYSGKMKKNMEADLVNTFVAIRNKKTNKVRLVQIDEVSMQNAIYRKLELDITSKLSEESKKNLLYKQFGSRKSGIYLDRIERMKVNVDIIKESLSQSVNNVDVTNSSDLQLNDELEIKPPLNVEAKNIGEVYELTDLIPKGLLDRMDEEIEAIRTSHLESLPIGSDYIREKIGETLNQPKSKDNENKIKSFVYMDALINLIKMRKRSLNEAVLSGITEKVENDIRERFSHPGIVAMTRSMYTKNKALCYFIALCLLMSPGNEMDINILTKELSTARSTIMKFVRLVHGKLKPRSDIITLCLPSRHKQISLTTKTRKTN